MHAYASGLNYQLSSDGHGGTKITVVSDNLVQGNDGNNLLIANLFSPVGSVLDGKGGNDILIGGLHSDVLNGGVLGEPDPDRGQTTAPVRAGA